MITDSISQVFRAETYRIVRIVSNSIGQDCRYISNQNYFILFGAFRAFEGGLFLQYLPRLEFTCLYS